MGHLDLDESGLTDQCSISVRTGFTCSTVWAKNLTKRQLEYLGSDVNRRCFYAQSHRNIQSNVWNWSKKFWDEKGISCQRVLTHAAIELGPRSASYFWNSVRESLWGRSNWQGILDHSQNNCNRSPNGASGFFVLLRNWKYIGESF